MAKFVYRKSEDGNRIVLEAADGETLPAEMVLAHANLLQSYELEGIADRIMGLDNAINELSRVVFER